MALPSLLIWTLFLPLYILLYLYKNRLNLNDQKIGKRYGYLYLGYRSEYVLWYTFYILKIILVREFVVLFRKILIIIVVNVIDCVLPAKALLLILILALSIYAQMEFSPFQMENFKRFENQGLFLNTMTIFLGMMNLLGNEDYFQVILTVLFVFFNILFYVCWFYYLFLRSVYRYCKIFFTKSSKSL